MKDPKKVLSASKKAYKELQASYKDLVSKYKENVAAKKAQRDEVKALQAIVKKKPSELTPAERDKISRSASKYGVTEDYVEPKKA
jgi:hypothetical protein